MPRYIDVDLKEAEIVDKIQEISAHPDVFIAVRRVLNLFPTADVEPVRHGRWVFAAKDNEHNYFICYECGERVLTAPYEAKTAVKIRFPYSHCGAKMDEEENEE